MFFTNLGLFGGNFLINLPINLALNVFKTLLIFTCSIISMLNETYLTFLFHYSFVKYFELQETSRVTNFSY
jgi:hypothetical protein